jgi:general secretion pathway protein I
MLGFTLLEVMIALLVIVLGIGAVINTTSESGWKSTQLKQKTIASWVAQNQIAEYRAMRTCAKPDRRIPRYAHLEQR